MRAFSLVVVVALLGALTGCGRAERSRPVEQGRAEAARREARQLPAPVLERRLAATPGSALEAALEAGRTRMRPVLMTALAMILGMLPMSLGLGEGGEQNAPLGRAVIGGLVLATASTLLFVPVVYSVLRRRAPAADAE